MASERVPVSGSVLRWARTTTGYDIDIDSGARRLKVSPATLARWEAEELAHSFVATVVDAFAGRALSSSDLVHYLGVRYDQVPSLEQALRR